MNYIYQEIHTQFDALETTQKYIDTKLDDLSRLISGAPLVVVGSGSSYSIACSVAWMARVRMGSHAVAIAAGDLLLHMDEYRPILEGCTLIVLSRSGETSEIVISIQNMKKAGIHFQVVGVSCVENSTLAKLSTLMIELPWAFDQSVCQTRTITTLFFFGAYMIAKLAGDTALTADILKAIQAGPGYFERIETQMKEIAGLPWKRAVVLGDAELSGLCDEGALAFKEICQIPSNYYHLLDVRHGPMVLIDTETLVIVVLSRHDNPYELDLVRDLQKKGAVLVVYSDIETELKDVFAVNFGETLQAPARGILAIVICQLISYYKSFLTKVDPDAPDGLAPWIKL